MIMKQDCISIGEDKYLKNDNIFEMTIYNDFFKNEFIKISIPDIHQYEKSVKNLDFH